MARISKFANENSPKSDAIIAEILKKSQIDHTDIERFQYRYGISNQDLSKLTGHGESQISTWQNGKSEIPSRAQQHFALLFAEFKKQFGE